MKKLFLMGIKGIKLMFRDRATLTFMLLAPFLLTLAMICIRLSYSHLRYSRL